MAMTETVPAPAPRPALGRLAGPALCACLVCLSVAAPARHQGSLATALSCGWPGVSVPGHLCLAWRIKVRM